MGLALLRSVEQHQFTAPEIPAQSAELGQDWGTGAATPGLQTLKEEVSEEDLACYDEGRRKDISLSFIWLEGERVGLSVCLKGRCFGWGLHQTPLLVSLPCCPALPVTAG